MFWYQSYMCILYNKQNLCQIASFPYYFYKLPNGSSSYQCPGCGAVSYGSFCERCRI